MNLHDLHPAVGAKSTKKIVGRGEASGQGKTAGKGHKGQKARSGAPRLGFEGGQMPLYRRLPKRGFKNINRKEFAPVNVSSLNVFEDGATVDVPMMIEKGIIKNELDGVKVLGNGNLEKKLTVKAKYFSKSAIEKIENAGGKAEVL
ncbi:MAG: 50S ribosomal protein L15 [Clostridia bacterium]|nr:50S ribosomal protein L15 [Clostridia bacterium]